MKQLSISRYERRAILGEGGMGRVSLAYDTQERREVALKEMLAGKASAADFKQEYWWMTRIRHPALVEVFDYGTGEAGQPFFTMELVGGRALDEQLPLAPDQVRDVICQLARALAPLHQLGLVHGDVKPQNIRRLEDGSIKLMDFGLMTRAGQVSTVRGTLNYMAPEVIQRARVDRRADLYAVGVLAYQLLTGRLPFEEQSTAALLRAHIEEPPMPPGRLVEGLEPRWDRVVMKLLAKDPPQRYQSAGELLEALGETHVEERAALLCSPFVGREGELETFRQALTLLKDEGRGGAIALGGPEGVGKSRLLDEFGLEATLADLPVLRGQAGAVALTPYEAFVQILRQVWPALSSLDDQVLEHHAPALHALVPDLVPASAAHRLEPQQEKLRLQAALAELLTALCQTSGRKGLVLMLDDWHQADPLSLELLGVLQRHFVGQPVLLVMAGRGDAPALAAGTTLLPGPLDTASLERLLGAMLGVDLVPSGFVDQIMGLTGGVPYAVESCLEHLVASGRLPQSDGRWMLGPLAAESLPSGAREVLQDRVAALTPLSRTVLELASLMGREFHLDLLFRLLPQVSPEEFYEALAELATAQFLSQRDGAYQADHGLVAEVLAMGLAPEARQALHTRIAEALEEVEPGADVALETRADGLVVRLAHHFLAGDRPAKAMYYALLAAQRTAALFANDQASELLQKGWDIVARQPDAPDSLKLDYLSLMGDLARIAGDYQTADNHYNQALPLALEQDNKEAIAHVLVGLGLVRQVVGQNDPALELFGRALPTCRQLPVAREELRCLAATGRAYYNTGDMQRSQATYEEALMRARTVGDLAYAGEALGFLGLLHVSAEPLPGVASRIGEGLDCLRQAITIKEAIGDKLGLNDSYMLLGNAQLALGDLPGAEHSFLRNQLICHEIGAFEEVYAFLNLGLVATERGDHLAALDRIAKAIELAGPRENQFMLGLAACIEARALLHLGLLARPLDMIKTSLLQARAADDAYWELFALVYLIEAELRMGRWDEAQTSLLEALEAQASSGVTEFNLVLPYYKAMLALRMGNTDPAESAFRDVLAKAEARESQLWEAHICLGLAELGHVNGQWHEASRWVTRAQERAGVADALELVAECHYLRGRIATATGDFVEADGHLQRAQETAVQLNLLDLMARVWYERGLLQFPSPQAAKLLKRAHEVMIQQVDGLPPDLAEPFLAAQARQAILDRALPGHKVASSGVGSGTGDDVGHLAAVETGLALNDHGALDEARQTITQQRVWLDELQHACGLLLKQLDFSQAIARTTDASHVITQALALLMEVGQAERGEIFILEQGRLQSRARKQLSSLQPIDEDWTHYIDFLNEATRSGEMVYVPDTDALPIPPRLAGPRSVLVLPLYDEKERVGAMLALGHANESSRLMKRELEALRVLAGQLGTALRNLRMQAEWREKTQRLEMLFQLSSTITSTLVMTEVLDLVVKLSLEITQGERGFLLLIDQNGELECKAARHGLGPISLPASGESYSQSICRRVLETGEALSVEDTQDDDVFRHAKSIQDLNLRTVMCVPLRAQSMALGVLYLDSRLVVKTFTNRDLELLKSIASHASIALENARLYNLATVDGLTQLFFRSHFEQRMREELNRAKRYDTPLSLMMMDIDHFKKFNDTYGHSVGDQVLRHVAAMIKNSVRQDVDIPARYGGEEMVVLLPETDAAGAAIFAERIRMAIDETLLEAEGLHGLHVTISIGIAIFPDDAETGLQLMERADKALYASKAAGRNKVTAYTPELGG